MKIIVTMEFRGYEESPYEMVSGQRVIKGVSRSLTFLDDNMQIIKVGIPKDSTFNVQTVELKHEYTLELDMKMQPVVNPTNKAVSQKQFQVYFQILDVVPFAPGNNHIPVPVPDEGGKKK